MGNRFFIQDDGLSVGSPQSSTKAIFFKQRSENFTTTKNQNHPKLRLRYMEDILVIRQGRGLALTEKNWPTPLEGRTSTYLKNSHKFVKS